MNKTLKEKVAELRINVKDWRIDLDAGIFEGMPEDVWNTEDLLAYIDVVEAELAASKADLLASQAEANDLRLRVAGLLIEIEDLSNG